MAAVNVLTVRTVRLALTGLGIDLFSLFVILPGGIVLELMTPAVLPVLLVTYTVITQFVPRVTVPPVKVTTVSPICGLKFGDPTVTPHPVTVGAVELLTVRSPGRLSVMLKFDRSVSAGAVTVSRKREFPPTLIAVGWKVLASVTPAPVV